VRETVGAAQGLLVEHCVAQAAGVQGLDANGVVDTHLLSSTGD
jgi:hypothetical protein